MQILDSLAQQGVAQLGAQRDRQQFLAPVAFGGGVGFDQRGWHLHAAARGKLVRALEAFDRQDAGNDRRGDALTRAQIAKAQKGFGLEEELGDGA